MPMDDSAINNLIGSNLSSDELFNLPTEEDSDTESVEDEVETPEEEAVADTEEEEEKETPEEEEAAEEPEEVKEEEKSAAPTRKKPFKITANGEDTKVSPTATITIKSNGEVKAVPLAEVVDSYTSKEENTKKFYELREKEKTLSTQVQTITRQKDSEIHKLKSEVETFSSTIQRLATEATKKDGSPLAVFGEILEGVGADPLAAIRSIRNDLIEQASAYLQMSPQERALLDYKEEVEYLRSRQQREAAKLKQEREAEESNTSFSRLLQETGIPDRDTFEKAKAHLEDTLKKKATNDEVAAWYRTYTVGRRVIDLAAKNGIQGLEKDTESLSHLVKAVFAFEPTEDELLEVIKERFVSTEKATTGQKERKLSTKPVKSESVSGTRKLKRDDLFL